jgi:hypothetical protein
LIQVHRRRFENNGAAPRYLLLELVDFGNGNNVANGTPARLGLVEALRYVGLIAYGVVGVAPVPRVGMV